MANLYTISKKRDMNIIRDHIHMLYQREKDLLANTNADWLHHVVFKISELENLLIVNIHN